MINVDSKKKDTVYIFCYYKYGGVNLKTKNKFIFGKNLKKCRLPLTPS